MNKQNYISKTHLTNTSKRVRKPSWIKVESSIFFCIQNKDIVKQFNLNTVCSRVACPNIGECWNNKHATFMI